MNANETPATDPMWTEETITERIKLEVMKASAARDEAARLTESAEGIDAFVGDLERVLNGLRQTNKHAVKMGLRFEVRGHISQ